MAVKVMQEQSGWGVKPTDNHESVNDKLEEKCTFFWRLEEIWGSGPNATMLSGSMESSHLSNTQDFTQLEWTPTPPLQESPPPQSPPLQSPPPESL